MPKLSALELPNNKIEENQLIRITTSMLKPKLIASIKKSKKKVNFIAFDLKQNDLNLKTGQKIITFLRKVKRNGINFQMVKPLPRCLFGAMYNEIIKEFNIKSDCKNCIDLFTIQKDGMIKFCKVLKNRMGPKIDLIKDYDQLFEYFFTFYKYLEVAESCKECTHLFRGKCVGICFRG